MANRVLERGEGLMVVVDRIHAVDQCLLVRTARGDDIEEGRRTNLVPLFREGQLFLCLGCVLLLQCDRLRRRLQREVRA